MKVAVIIAGGSGARMGQDIPKQFINVYDKPVLIYTLESFQSSIEKLNSTLRWNLILPKCGPAKSGIHLF